MYYLGGVFPYLFLACVNICPLVGQIDSLADEQVRCLCCGIDAGFGSKDVSTLVGGHPTDCLFQRCVKNQACFRRHSPSSSSTCSPLRWGLWLRVEQSQGPTRGECVPAGVLAHVSTDVQICLTQLHDLQFCTLESLKLKRPFLNMSLCQARTTLTHSQADAFIDLFMVLFVCLFSTTHLFFFLLTCQMQSGALSWVPKIPPALQSRCFSFR